MQTIEYRTVDKSAWGPGPWQGEVDKKQWLDPGTGLPCLLKRNPEMGFLCGYVGVPRGHPLFGSHCDRADRHISVHGGLSFASKCSPEGDEATSICHAAEPGEDDEVWWLGFDCGHAFDHMPGMAALGRRAGLPPRSFSRDESYRDQAFVEAECAKLARALADVTAEEVTAVDAEKAAEEAERERLRAERKADELLAAAFDKPADPEAS